MASYLPMGLQLLIREISSIHWCIPDQYYCQAYVDLSASKSVQGLRTSAKQQSCCLVNSRTFSADFHHRNHLLGLVSSGQTAANSEITHHISVI